MTEQPPDILGKAHERLIPFARLMYDGFIAPPYMQKIAEKLEAVERGDIRRLILTVPPRHGKSLLASQLFPAWFLGRNPRAKIMLSSHTQMLANDFGRNTRNFMLHKRYSQIFPGITISGDSSSKSAFATNMGGEAFYMGVGGALLGRGADCFPAGTMIQTEAGTYDIADLHNMKNPPRVLSYDHESGTIVYQNIQASRIKYVNELCESSTVNGKHLISTPEHTVFCSSKNQYLPIKNLTYEKICTYNSFNMQFLSNRIRSTKKRIPQEHSKGSQGQLLLSTMFNESSRDQESPEMRNLSGTSKQKNKKILRSLQKTYDIRTTQDERGLFDLSNNICHAQQQENFLLPNMCEFGAFTKNDWNKQFKLQNRQELCEMVRRNEPTHKGTGQQLLCDLSTTGKQEDYSLEKSRCNTNKSSYSSRRSQSGQQYSNQFDCSMSNLPSGAPSLQTDTITRTRLYSCKKVAVYDIQVEGTNNFFANEILVHNCALIDDPVKNAEEADSETYIKKLRDWYRETLYTRQMSGGRIVIIMQRWRANDLIGWLLDPKEQEEVEDWEMINFPALAGEDDVLGRQPGEALWPERYPEHEIEKIRKAIGTRSFNGLYQQKPTLEEGAIVKRAWLAVEEIPDTLLIPPRIAFFDTAFKEGEMNDYSAYVVAQRMKNHIAILHAGQKRLDFPKLLDWIKYLAQAFELQGIVVEDKASGISVVQTLKAQTKLPVIAMPIRGKMDKEQRLHAITPLLESGRVILHKWSPHQSQEDLITQLLQFPTGSHDDLVDSFVGAITYLTRPGLSLRHLMPGSGFASDIVSIYER